MRFIHTADWHLGKVLHGQSMIHDQRDMLVQLINAVKNTAAKMVVISGDIFDSRVPTVESLEMFNEVLYQLVVEHKVKVLAVRGNHDCPARLSFGSQLMKRAGYHVAGNLEDFFEPVDLEDEHGPLTAYLIPYACLDNIRKVLGDKEITTYGEAYAKMLRKIRATMKPDRRTILVTHALVTPGGIVFNSEPDTFQSLADHPMKEPVPLEYFSGFHYTALGHLHESLTQDNQRASYPGAPLKYTFKNYEIQPGFNVVELDGSGQVTIERWPVKPVKDLIVVEGKLNDILQHPISENYTEVRLFDETYLPQASKVIKEVYPNVLLIRQMYHFSQHEYALHKPWHEEHLREQHGIGSCSAENLRHSKRVKRCMIQLLDELSLKTGTAPVYDLK